ncbi:MAG TPA: superoxide dismutase [Spirochaetia bacterium]|nr:superoxide dismutase [Spirochaetia bacterium]
MAFTLPDLPYPFDALEPHIDAKTMEIHHDKHHGTYVSKLNAALEKAPSFQTRQVDEILRSLDSLPRDIQTAVRNHGGGHYNHSLFWKMLSPKGGGQPSGDLAKAIDGKFGSFDKFKEQFAAAAANLFGSGWAWLVVDPSGDLSITTTPNQDNPVSQGLHPIFGLDVWEHAYYLKYQNRRPDYITAVWNVVSWAQVAENLKSAK